MTRSIPALTGLLLCAAALTNTAFAQNTDAHQGHHANTGNTAAPASAMADWAEAEVRRVDTNAGKVTLKHGDIQNLGMPPMTMVFQVREPQMLTNIKVGDRVRFTADRINGAYTVLQLETQP